MSSRKNLVLSWNGDKDSAVSFFELKSPDYEIVGLISVVIQEDNPRLKSNDIPIELIEAQARALDLPLIQVPLSERMTKELETAAFQEAIETFQKSTEVDAIAFNENTDEKMKKEQLELAKDLNLQAVFPLWGWPPALLVQAFEGLGHQALVHAIDSAKIKPDLLGRHFNKAFIEELKPGLSICGHNGEFQTFVFSGPFFEFVIPVKAVGQYEKGSMVFQELCLSQSSTSGHNRVN